MLQFTAVALFVFLGQAQAVALPSIKSNYAHEKPAGTTPRLFESIPEDINLKWHPCSDDAPGNRFKCARLSVPLDYKQPRNGLRAIIPIVKYPAASGTPYRGSVLLNPGGPGGLGTELVYNIKVVEHHESNIVGPGWDLIGFDPRGVGYSVPHADCGDHPEIVFDPKRQNATVTGPKSVNPLNETISLNSTRVGGFGSGLVERGSQWRHALNITTSGKKNFVFGMLIPEERPQASDNSTSLEKSFSQCVKTISAYNQAGRHMNTPVVATDMLSIAKALARERKLPENAALVNYIGYSYGTILGQYFASMYPSKVGKFVLDGVADASAWMTHEEEAAAVRYADEAWSRFFPLCKDAGQSRCSFHTRGGTEAILQRFNNITAKLDYTKYNDENATTVVANVLNDLKSQISSSLYNPSRSFPSVANYLVTLESKLASNNPLEWNTNDLQPKSTKQRQPPLVSVWDPRLGIQVGCSDARDGQHPTEAEVSAFHKSSRIMSYYGFPYIRQTCSEWPIRPTWEWYGPIGGTPSNPILFFGNHFDPVTPYENAEKASALFKNSRMVFVDEISHTMSSTKNTCAFGHSLAYFQNGTVPAPGARCNEETNYFAK
ncbi:hypothetical protein TWF694_002190 [Orbilia ellipsospora]|uniref:Peptidase S33 tripeptidyl aminopeptidase-like C-terminal domain-containing protein n=1 Tax=Orbilia ellipsospora TaxID=2528407 RepID=A0AAV9X4V5_9PEZI